MEIRMAKIKSVERDASIVIKLSGLLKYFSEVNRRETGAKIMQFTPLIPSGLPLQEAIRCIVCRP